MAVNDEPLSDETLRGREEGLADLEAGRVRPLRDIAKEMGILYKSENIPQQWQKKK